MTDLEYSSLISQISMRCHSELGKALSQKLRPLADLASVRASQNLIHQFQEALDLGIDMAFEDLQDLNPLFEEPGIFAWEEFQIFAFNADLGVYAFDKYEAFEDLPLAQKLIKKIKALPEIGQGFRRIFDFEGEVQDDASPELKRIRKEIFAIRARLQKTMQSLLEKKRQEGYLQEDFITQREGRYVLPVKESAAPFVNGIVQGRSASKSTLFIEPAEIVPVNNELQLAFQDEKREIYRILKDFSESIRAHKKELLNNQLHLAQLDFLYACARLGLSLKSEIPVMQEEPVLELLSARHPLLILRLLGEKGKAGFNQVVPFDLELGQKAKLMVLSGPNTGGKTVLMKAVGLITLMALSGLPVPVAAQSKIGLFEKVFADIGDDQSIENALSTFSSHLDKICRMLEAADEKSLVLIDEIGAATDPQQGSALAQAILERLAEMKVKGIVTTHYTALKIFAESHINCVNASMQFDLKSMQPSYRFSIGLPGDSFAIEVAAALGMQPELIARARALAGSQNIEFTALLKKMQDEKKSLARQSYEYQLKVRNLEAKIQEANEREEDWQKELKERRKKHLKELQGELIHYQKVYNKEISEIKNLEREERKRLSERKLHTINVKSSEISKELMRENARGHQALENPKIGDRIWLANFDADATILELSEKNAKVDMNGISFSVGRSQLYPPKDEAKAPAKPLTRVHSEKKVQTELMLLGCTFDEAMPLIDEFLDNAAMTGFSTLRIVHGKGTGALRQKVRAYLRKKKMIKSIETPPLMEGGDGATVVRLA